MKPIRVIQLLLSAIAFILLTDYLIHGVILKPYYQNRQELWREPKDCIFPVMMLGQMLVAFSLTFLFKQCLTMRVRLREAFRFGMTVGLIGAGRTLTVFALQNMPSAYYTTWMAAGLAQALLLAALIYLVSGGWKPRRAS